MLRIYYIASLLIGLFAPLWLLWREKKGKEEAIRRCERYGKASLPRPDGALLWVHAASMGEAQSVLPLIERWLKTHTDVHILLTTGTVTSARHVVGKLPERAFHQYVPLDIPWMVQRFLNHWQPDMVMFVDSELWPNTINAIGARDIPLNLLNGRISERSAKRWHKARQSCEQLLQHFTHIFAKSEEDAKRFANLGASNPVSFGNMKFSSPPLPADPKCCGELIHQIADRPVWLAASTHEGEEKMIGDIHRELRDAFDGLLTIIVPRHEHRGDAICQILEQDGLQVSQRSKQMHVLPDTDIYVADTMGELGVFYRIASIVFVGGSLVPHGGQNPFEPARLDCAILYGPHMHNFNEFCSELESNEAAIRVNDTQELQTRLETLLRDHDAQHKLASAALDTVQKNLNVIDRLEDALVDDIKEIIAHYA